MCCRLGIDSGSFTRAAKSLWRVGELRLSDELMRKIVESEGKTALIWQDQATIPLTWDAESTITTATEDVKLFRADQIVAVTDGAEWIARVLAGCLPEETTTFILDFYHATEHVHKARRDIWGEASPEGEQWAKDLIGRMYEEDFTHWSQALITTRASLRGPAKRKAIDALIGYLFSRKEKIEYGQFRLKGMKIGSGPTESSCKSEARRLKGIGMRWKQRNADGMLALEALHQSDLWQTYWKSKFKTAA